VRIVEDTNSERWGSKLPSNIKVIAISKYITNHLPVKSILVYDPYPFTQKMNIKLPDPQDVFHIGIIGRVSVSKGIDNVLQLLQEVKANGRENEFSFHFFGDITEDVRNSGRLVTLKNFTNVVFEGFVDNKESIYKHIDCIVHGAFDEPLGRIFLEAIDQNLPFIGIHSGGIGEIAALTGLDEMMVPADKNNIGKKLFIKMEQVKNDYVNVRRKMVVAKQKAEEIFNLKSYTQTIDSLLTS
jgi:glycosyltransferase involved in cell wall biosynthesis